MIRSILLFVFTLLITHTGFSQIVKGLSYGKFYTVERIAEIHADKEVKIKDIYKGKRVEIRLTEDDEPYLLIDLEGYTDAKGGRLDRIMLAGIGYEEADRYFKQYIESKGEPLRGYEEQCDFVIPYDGRYVGWRKGAVYSGNRITGDRIAIRISDYILRKRNYVFEINYTTDKNELGNLSNPQSNQLVPSSWNWQLMRTYGAGAKVKYY